MKHTIGATCLLFSLTTGVHAANILQSSNMSAGNDWSGNFWNDPTPTAPASGKTYENALGGLSYTRTAAGSGDSSFAGDSLLLSNNSTLLLKTTGTSTVNLIMTASTTITSGHTGASLANGGSNNATLAGTLSLIGTGTVTFDAQGSNRISNVSSLMTADASVDTLVLTALQTALTTNAQAKASGFNFTNASNVFTGLWDIQQGSLIGSGFGLSSFQVGNVGYLNFDSDFTNENGSLTLLNGTVGGQLLLDQNLTFGSVDIYGTSLAAGEYTGAYLKSTYGAAFDSTSLDGATITVIPEPSSFVLLGLAMTGLLARRRRA